MGSSRFQFERLEARILLSADPLVLGLADDAVLEDQDALDSPDEPPALVEDELQSELGGTLTGTSTSVDWGGLDEDPDTVVPAADTDAPEGVPEFPEIAPETDGLHSGSSPDSNTDANLPSDDHADDHLPRDVVEDSLARGPPPWARLGGRSSACRRRTAPR